MNDYRAACQMAQNLARNCGYAAFPCKEDKSPATPHGCKDASRNPEQVAQLWRRNLGPLVGIATGKPSGISVLDIDRKHPAAIAWWCNHCDRLLPTRTYETRSGGLHCFFRHLDGVRNSGSRLCTGIDTRGDGGYVISWWCAGYGCFDHSPPAPWPAWLLAELTRGPPAPRVTVMPTEHALAGIVRRVACAAEGERNSVLFWAACRLFERGLSMGEAETVLILPALNAGLSRAEARRTLVSAFRRRAAA
jgi:hypothetical protein